MSENINDSTKARRANEGPEGRLMALDLGEKRIGVAVSDEGRTLARSLTVLERKSRAADFERIGRIVNEQKVSMLVIGLPIMASGEEGEKARWVRDYASDLQRHLSQRIVLWDEAYTTVQAEASLRERGIRGRKRRKRVDAVAAAFILQSFLDSHAIENTDETLP